MNRRNFLALGAVVLTAPTLLTKPVLAQSHSHPHTHEGKFGGRVAEGGDHHVELVIKEDVIEVYVSDEDDKPLKSTGYKGVAIFTVAGKSQRITLEPSGDTLLSGKAAMKLAKNIKGAVQITTPKGKTFTARFS